MKRTLFCTILILLGFFLNAQDVIYLIDGSEIQAKIIELTNDLIKYKRFDQLDGPLRNISNKDVFMIIYEDGTREIIKETYQKNETETVNQPITYQIPQNLSQTEINLDKNYVSIPISMTDKCIHGTNDADNLHGKGAAHFIYGVAFGPFALIGAAVSTPTPETGIRTTMMSPNKSLFNDPSYRTCYTQKARKKNIGNAALGWATWVLAVLVVSSYSY
ncbi:MAG: hypothetical protein JW894_04870 [Bacteroidales bacterium]|nr:hypothetical protein [Bacteroidales bacterium]